MLVAVMVMGVAVVVLIGGIGTGLRLSDFHRKQAAAGAYVRAYAEAIETAVAGEPSAYVDCAGPGTFATAYTPPDPNFAASVVSVTYWNGSSFGGTCTAGSDTGIQRLSLKIVSTDNLAAETLDLIIRRPCRSVMYFPLDPPCS
jgi:hypothetical protein